MNTEKAQRIGSVACIFAERLDCFSIPLLKVFHVFSMDSLLGSNREKEEREDFDQRKKYTHVQNYYFWPLVGGGPRFFLFRHETVP